MTKQNDASMIQNAVYMQGEGETTWAIRFILGGVTAAKGFEAAATAAGIKYSDRTDMALIYSEKPCRAAGVFTTNVVKAAPVIRDRRIIQSGEDVHAVVVNSGIANACTGVEGLNVCAETAAAAAECLGLSGQQAQSVLIGSTGVIGMPLPMDKIRVGVAKLAQTKGDRLEHGTAAAQAIMTTDTKKKEIAVCVDINGVSVTIGAMAKGSGMIHPNMCTMLAYVTTDAAITQEALQKALSDDAADTYNMISVDGDTSTNDTVLLLANGQAKNDVIEYGTAAYDLFKRGLHMVNETLAKAIAADGEGATALLEVHVTGAGTTEQAKCLAKSVASSSLVKTALAGHDANWGRILCAMGYSGVAFDPDKVSLYFKSEAGDIQVVGAGMAVPFDEQYAAAILSAETVRIVADIQAGEASATAWGCDLTHEYITINADYRS